MFLFVVFFCLFFYFLFFVMFFFFFFFYICVFFFFFFFFQAEDGIRDADVTGVQTCALPISVSIWTLSIPLILAYQHSAFLENLFLNTYFLIGFTLMVSIFMNMELRLFALKFKTWSWADNKIRYGFLLLSILSIVFLKFKIGRA